MKNRRLNLFVLGVLLAVGSFSFARTGEDHTAASPAAHSQTSHIMVTPEELKWGPGPPALPAGAQMAVLEGDPSQAGPFTVRLTFPNGFMISPHWHPTDEHVTVLKGKIMMGVGEKFDRSVAKILGVGSFTVMPQGVKHFAWTRGETTIQVAGIGPFTVTYVNPRDDPRNKVGQ